MTCTRCQRETMTHTMSMFNTDLICIPCKDKEKAHPEYDNAVEAERNAVIQGDYNFKGIGKPDNL